MKLPHVRNSAVAQQSAEAIFGALYEMQLFPPQGIPFVEYLKDEITSISGLGKIDELPEIVTQLARGHTRVFMKPYLDSTHLELELKVNINASGVNADQIVIYEMFKQWARRQRDERTGAMGIKANCVGSGELSQANKPGFAWRRIDLKRILIQSIEGFDEAALENGDPIQLTVKIVVEEWDLLDAGTV
ncbi:hypothetical protein MA9V2_056 [Chryseobacterium phage MA9V-2]|nr:hypothetical protein MA9V2_056 [Chryseobacterium phage MA9V-2]